MPKELHAFTFGILAMYEVDIKTSIFYYNSYMLYIVCSSFTILYIYIYIGILQVCKTTKMLNYTIDRLYIHFNSMRIRQIGMF